MNGKGTATLKEKYYLHQTLGRNTHWGTERTTGEPVVVKTCALTPAQSSTWQDWARRLKRFQHRHLARVRDYFVEGDQGYLVYEYVPGQSLAQLLKFGLVIPQSQALRAICQVSAALCSLHSQGIQHLGINPAKLILKKDSNDVVLIDVGLEWQLFPLEITTPEETSYLPPEQGETEDYTPSMDIFALAATLHTLLTGHPPQCTVTEDAWDLPTTLSPTVQTLLQQGLALDPDQRPQTIKAWLSPLLSKSKETISQPKTVAVKTPVSPPPDPQTPAQKETAVAAKTSPTLPVTTPPVRPSQDKPLAPQMMQNLSATPTLSLSLFPRPQDFQIYDKLQGWANNHPIWDQVRVPAVKQKLGDWLSSPPTSQADPLTVKGLIQGMAMTSAIALSAGIGFGLAIQTNRPTEAGATILHQEQSFPPKEAWPVSQPTLKNAEMIEPEAFKIITIDSLPDS
jgi:serine/threonine protein kinase